MKKNLVGIVRGVFAVMAIMSSVAIFSFKSEEKIKVAFLVHDLVADRWSMEMENFVNKVTELGGEAITRNGLGDPATQVKQGKLLVDEGVKVLVVVPQDARALAELVTYADKAGAKVIAYDRMIVDCNLHYYISFNSVRVGEMMAEYALKIKPKGNYVILNGPSTDNNAILVRQGIMNKLKGPIEAGNVKVLLEKEMSSWYALSSMAVMDEFTSVNKAPIDAIITGADDLAVGVIDVLRRFTGPMPVITGQDASVEARQNIVLGYQSMTVYKSVKKLSSEAATLAMKIAKGEKVDVNATTNNGKKEVPSILFDPVMVDKSNLQTATKE
jgi:D-xylose transport system substrate-binding protein